jgi:F0F1-type ATP synthase delta subunit
VKRYLSTTFTKDEILIENIIDRTIIGGMIIQYEDRRLDMSVLKELQEIKKQLIYN